MLIHVDFKCIKPYALQTVLISKQIIIRIIFFFYIRHEYSLQMFSMES